MEVEIVKLVCFSPTGTTKSVVESIGLGVGIDKIELIDITNPEAREKKLLLTENEALVIGVPVYMGRVPAVINDWINSIEGCNTPAVCVVVYGNREYDNALFELKDMITERGCHVIGGAAFVGEHSFSCAERPTAEGRPDEVDLNCAEQLGSKINKKLLEISSDMNNSDIKVRGKYPYDGVTKLWDLDFIEVTRECIECGLCSAVCPVGAIDSVKSNLIDIEKCITCCACIKSCPQNARKVKPSPVEDASYKLFNLYHERKEPEYFL